MSNGRLLFLAAMNLRVPALSRTLSGERDIEVVLS
jgi:hypothetical protein